MPEHRGRGVIDGDALAAQPVAETVETHLADVDGAEGGAVQQRPEDVHDGGIDAVRGEERQPIVGGEAKVRGVGLDEMQDVPLVLQDTLRPAGGSGSIYKVGGIIR